MASKAHAVESFSSDNYSSQISSCQKPEMSKFLSLFDIPRSLFRQNPEIFVLFLSLFFGILLSLFRQQFVNGFAENELWAILVVISVELSFVGASVSLLIRIMPGQWHATIPRRLLRISSASLASAVFIMAYVFFLKIFQQISSGLNEDGGDSFFVYSYVFQVFRKICTGSEEQR